MSTFFLTASQTVGPFFEPCLLRDGACRNVLTRPETIGEHIRVEGRVIDGDGTPVPDALIEIWQADAHGRYNHPADKGTAPPDPDFTGFGRSGSAEDGSYWFDTIKPGPVPFDAQQWQAPHIVVTIFARGLLNHLVTRLYFADEPANASDPILQYVPDARRPTLLATRAVGTRFIASGNASGDAPENAPAVYRFDIILQGKGETVFFNL
jgi:protocatechuate 3,4-dioxygenase alpha subunit